MTDRYPGYDVLAKRDGISWNAATRAVVDHRLAVPQEPRFFSAVEWRTLGAIAARILPQPAGRPAVPLAAYVDQKMFVNHTDGYRFAEMPKQGEAWRRGLAGFDEAAEAQHGGAFHALAAEAQDDLLRQAEAGKLAGGAWGDMPSKLFFQYRVIPDIVHAYYAHPTAWNEIGWGGPASPRGYVRMRLDRRDPWEAAEGKPGHEAEAARENARVR